VSWLSCSFQASKGTECRQSTNHSGSTWRWRCSDAFGGATAFPKAKGIWRDDERGGTLVEDEPIVVHCYTTPFDIEDDRNLAALGDFCRKLGRETRQGEIGLVVGDEYFAIRDFNEGATT
jgi:hypothetical protein